MATSYSHEKLSEKVDIVFADVIQSFIPGVTTEQEIEQTVSAYLNENFPIESTDKLYVNAMVGDISYMAVSDLIDDLKQDINLTLNATLRSLSPMERNTEFLDTSLDEVYLPCSDSRATPSSPLQLEWRLDFPGPTREAS